LFQRSSLNFFRSEFLQTRGIKSVKPISIAFSKNHSIRSLFFVGAIATVILKEFLRRGGLRCRVLSSSSINKGDKIKVLD